MCNASFPAHTNLSFDHRAWIESCGTTEAAAEVAAVFNDFDMDMRPLPAYRSDGTLIFPHQYAKELPGTTAVVDLKFTRQHYHIINFDEWHANIAKLQVIVPPQQQA